MTLNSILGPLKRSVFLPIKKYIITLPFLAKGLIVLAVVLVIPFTYILIKRIKAKRQNGNAGPSNENIKDVNQKSVYSTQNIKDVNQKSASSVQNIKCVKKAISKYKFNQDSCRLHILIMTSKYMSAPHLYNKMEVIEVSEGIAFAFSKDNFSLLIADSCLEDVEILKSKLKLIFNGEVNIHFNVTESEPKIEMGFLQQIYPLKLKNIIANFYSDGQAEIIESFNEIIGKDNLFVLNSEPKCLQALIEFTLPKIISSKESNASKHSCTLIFYNIYALLNVLYEEIGPLESKLYAFLLLNKNNNSHNQLAHTISNKKNFLVKNVIIGTVSLCFSVIFIMNIISISNNRYKDEEDIHRSNQLKSLPSLKAEVDNNIILSSIYPSSIKYKYIYIQYANFLVKNKLIPLLKKTDSLSQYTAVLVYITHLNNKDTTIDIKNSLPLLTKHTGLKATELQFIKKYIDDKSIEDLIKTVNQESARLYNIKVDDIEASKFFSKRYENNYFAISDAKRANVIYESIEESLQKCDAENLLSLLNAKEILPKNFSIIFELYKKRTENTQKICSSGSIEIMASNMHMINNYLVKLEVKDVEKYVHLLSEIVSKLEKSGEKLKDANTKEYNTFQKYLPVLISYAINSITNSIYNENSDYNKIVLINNFNKDLYISFNPNFYNIPVSISPIYSKEIIEDTIKPLMEQFNKLEDKLITKYKINNDLLSLIFKDTLQEYVENYIKSYSTIIKEMYSGKVEAKSLKNDGALKLYLITMDAKDSSLNNFIKYYQSNTSIKIKGFEKINKSFNVYNSFLSSNEYDKYRSIFLELKNMIVANGYDKTYNEINNGYEPLINVYSSLAKINSGDNNLYLLLKKHLDLAVHSIESIAIDEAVRSLSKSVNLDYFYLDSFLPFNLNSDQVLSNKDLISYIGNSGSIYFPYKTLLEPLLKKNKIKNNWYNHNFSSLEERLVLKQFNKIYKFHDLLLNTDGSAKSLALEMTPIQSRNNNYMFYSFQINSKTFVNSLNIDYHESMTISYDWSIKEPVTITLKLDNGEIIQKSYTGDWALIKAIKAAKVHNSILTWELISKGQRYPVSFKIESPLINELINKVKK